MKISNISREGLKSTAFIINPWLYLATKIFKFKLRFNNYDWSILSITIILGSITLLNTSNLNILPQMVGVFFLLGNQLTPSEIEKKTTVLILRLYLLFGSAIALYSFINSFERSGLFGSEINFTGYTTLLILIVFAEIDRLKKIDLILTFLLIFITGSRAFALMFLIYFILKKIQDKSYLLLLILSSAYLVYFSAQLILIYSDSIPFLKESGYINDYSRLYQLNDSSTKERIRIISEYFNEFSNSAFKFYFGFPKNTLNVISMESHNSLIQKIYEYGFLHTLIILNSMFRKLPLYIFVFISIYGLFLHNLFSLPAIIFLSYFITKKSNQTI